MTTPTQPLITMAALRSWTQRQIPDDDPLANNILMGVSIKLWEHGLSTWTADTLPPEIRLMGELKAKNFYEHPRGASREQVDVISETFINDVLLQLTFTDGELQQLGAYADAATPEIELGVWALTVTRGPLETHGADRAGTAYYLDSWGTQFPLLVDGAGLGWPKT